MDTIGIILAVMILANLAFALINQNWTAACGWLVAGLEWSRRITNA